MLPSQRHLFSIPEDVAYFNCATTSPLLRAAQAAGEAALAAKAHPWTITPAAFFRSLEAARALFAEIFGLDGDDVCIVPAASYGLALAARALPLPPGKAVLVLEEQFPSNVYCWKEKTRREGGTLRVVPRPADDDWTAAVLERLDEDVAIAALEPCHWTDGTLVDLTAVAARCKQLGAALAVDATQALGAMPLDVQALDPDFLVAASHKWLFGAYSMGFAYVAPRWRGTRPLEENWLNRAGSENLAGLANYVDGHRPGARKFDMGEASQFLNMPVAEAGLRQIRDWGVPAIAATIAPMLEAIARAAEPLGFQAPAQAHRAPHYMGLRWRGGMDRQDDAATRVPEGFFPALAKALAAENVFVSVRGSSIRVSPHVHNTAADLDRLVATLAGATRELIARG